jgi:CO/xanthine dehydrogenase Mo-binding subunit
VIASAIEDALKPFGVRIRDLPITPERLRALIGAAKSSASPGRMFEDR